MARGNGRMRIFEDDTDYRYFVTLFGDIMEEFEIQCWNYCVMPNHYHATLQPTLPNLSRAIQRLNRRYAQRWNKRYDRVGHVFQGRFKDQIVQREGYLRVCADMSPGTRAAPTWSTHLKTGNGAATQRPSACDRLRALSTCLRRSVYSVLETRAFCRRGSGSLCAVRLTGPSTSDFARATRSSGTTSSGLVSCPGPTRVLSPRTLRMNHLEQVDSEREPRADRKLRV